MLRMREAFTSLRMTNRNEFQTSRPFGRDFILGQRGATKMKNRKNLGVLIKGTKERGAWAELYFMVMAMSQGLKVSSPYGGLGPYDVGVENGGPILRVQVKCTLYQCSKGCYCMSVNVKDGSRRTTRVCAGDGGLFRDLHYSDG
jgi:PD-(D/E)XK endonuclease